MNIGDRVRVVTKWPEIWIHAKEPFQTRVYEGTIVRGNPHLDPPGSFNLLTGDPNYPVSIIQMDRVVEWEVIGKVKGAPLANKTRYILVRTTKGKEHRVSIHSSGHVACDCVGFNYRRKCSHSADARAYLIKKFGTAWVKEVFK